MNKLLANLKKLIEVHLRTWNPEPLPKSVYKMLNALNRAESKALVGLTPEEAGGPPIEENLPEVKASSELKIGEFTLEAYVLADGRRIIEKKGFDKFLDYLVTGGTITPEDEKKVANFVKGFAK